MTIIVGVNNNYLSINIVTEAVLAGEGIDDGSARRALFRPPDMTREILKIGLAVLDGDRLLLVKKRNSEFYILPGGKPEQGESDIETLSREIDEELGCGIASDRLCFLGTFSDEVAGEPDARVTIRLYVGALIGTPSPRSEIESVRWWTRTHYTEQTLAPSLRNSILPFLCYTHPETHESQKAARLR